jgi:isocitrate dehydrogenase
MNNSPLDLAVAKSSTNQSAKMPITVAYGDGIGPEIMDSTLSILEAAGAQITVEPIEIGERVYLSGNSAGIDSSAWESLRRTKVFLKAPVTTPSGSGYKSLNVTIRKTLGLYANVRPCVSYSPFIDTKHPKMDMVIVRENEEDLYAGIEHRQTDEVFQCLKLITRPGCEKIVRYAFEYARNHGRKKVTCMVKDNIMKMTDGLFAQVFEDIGAEYPEILKERYIIDIGAARIATRPERFDVIVTPNLYGDRRNDRERGARGISQHWRTCCNVRSDSRQCARHCRARNSKPERSSARRCDDARSHSSSRYRNQNPQRVVKDN